MRARRDNKEISDEEYIEWKLHFEIENEIKWMKIIEKCDTKRSKDNIVHMCVI
jgi:hypothetical protein